ncbi:MAG TPA: PepSY-like domain-containing protein [Puia sp.]|nr:PepSY-like domain-containing protein [Puia sp.]
MPELCKVNMGFAARRDSWILEHYRPFMKKLMTLSILFACSFGFISNSFGQFRKIPAEVTEALKSRYPGASNVSWKDKISVFVASFDMGNGKYQARFDENGEWKSTEKEITKDELPENIKDGWEKSKYADWNLNNVYSIELPDNVMQYRLQVSKSDVQKKNLLFNSDGKLLRDNITL